MSFYKKIKDKVSLMRSEWQADIHSEAVANSEARQSARKERAKQIIETAKAKEERRGALKRKYNAEGGFLGSIKGKNSGPDKSLSGLRSMVTGNKLGTMREGKKPPKSWY